MNELVTELGKLYVIRQNDDAYPGFLIGLERNGVRYEFGWVEVDQEIWDDNDRPTLKIHVFGTESDDPVYDLTIKEEQLKKLYKEEK